MVDIGKAFNAAKLPTLLIIVIWFGVALLAQLVPVLAILYLVQAPLTAVLFAWAGYKAVKEMKLDLVHAGLAGVIAALISGIVTTILDIILVVLGFGVAAATTDTGAATLTGGLGLVNVAVKAIFNIPLSIIINFVVAVVGGFIAQKL